MRVKLPRYVNAFTDRHGKARYYYRRHGKRIRLPGLPWSPDFMAAHAAAEAGATIIRPEIGSSKTLPGSINALCVAYLNSPRFQSLSEGTKATYRGILDRFRAEYGDRSYSELDKRHVSKIIDLKAKTPAAAGNLLRMVRLLMHFAVDEGWRNSDPTIGLKAPKTKSGGFHSWTDAEIARFEDCHPIGSRARLAFSLLLCTAQRRGDIVRMGRQHIKDGYLSIRQQKTGTLVEIPIVQELRDAIEASAKDNLTFLVTQSGKNFTSAGFGNWFRDMCNEAGIPGECSAHGLRKACARRLAEAGCTAHEIMSVTGHRTLREVTRYTDAVDRRALAVTAMEKIGKGTSSGKP